MLSGLFIALSRRATALGQAAVGAVWCTDEKALCGGRWCADRLGARCIMPRTNLTRRGLVSSCCKSWVDQWKKYMNLGQHTKGISQVEGIIWPYLARSVGCNKHDLAGHDHTDGKASACLISTPRKDSVKVWYAMPRLNSC